MRPLRRRLGRRIDAVTVPVPDLDAVWRRGDNRWPMRPHIPSAGRRFAGDLQPHSLLLWMSTHRR